MKRNRIVIDSYVLDCAKKSIATVQMKSSGIVLMNFDVGGEDSVFNREVFTSTLFFEIPNTNQIFFQALKLFEKDYFKK